MANALVNETSPYLLQHAHNPVHWQVWSEACFEQAKHENKPILVSIGYSSCHWCHVMEHESFEDAETAQLMNNLFVCIKVDREERPDIDHIYMDAVQAMTGSGGWPLHVFLNHDKNAFYGGTYFPPTRMYNRASWKEVLINVSQYFSQNREEVHKQAKILSEHLYALNHKINTTPATTEEKATEENDVEKIIQQTCNTIMQHADTIDGGFGTAPKFPSTHTLKYLLECYLVNKEEKLLQHVVLSLDKMMCGGLYDHIGGGFARYSTDAQWLAPHFEKMLYDNALLIEVYALAYSITNKKEYKYVIEHTIAWLLREMQAPEGGFYSAQDADSEGVEGKYYTWQKKEIETILGVDANAFCEQYNFTEEGNWEHTNIIHTTTVQEPLYNNLYTLLQQRTKRIKPLTDDKQLLAWNALLIYAFSKAGCYIQEEKYILLAEQTLQHVLKVFQQENDYYFHTYKNSHAKIPCFADDAVYLVQACLELANSTGNIHYVQVATNIQQQIEIRYKKGEDLFLSYAQWKYNEFNIPKYDMYDGALPSVNAIHAKNIRQLAISTEKKEGLILAEAMLQKQKSITLLHPTSHSCWALEIIKKELPLIKVEIKGEHAKKYFLELYTKLKKINVVYVVTQYNTHDNTKHDDAVNTATTKVFICKGEQCYAPVSDVESVLKMLL